MHGEFGKILARYCRWLPSRDLGTAVALEFSTIFGRFGFKLGSLPSNIFELLGTNYSIFLTFHVSLIEERSNFLGAIRNLSEKHCLQSCIDFSMLLLRRLCNSC